MESLNSTVSSNGDPDQASNALPALTLHKTSSFWGRLQGLHAWPCLPWHTGLHLSPCRAIHTFGMNYAIDVVFLDARHKPLKQLSALGAGRIAFCLSAASVVELPAGYCLAYPDYAQAIRRCLHHGHRYRPDYQRRTR